jgi:ATP-binding cassette subfamily F protein uup
MLDEPTNDLDTDTLSAIEDVLDGWPGTLVVVSHDRYLLERVTDSQMALLGDGRLRDLPGGVDQYLELRNAAGPMTATGSAASPAISGGSTGGSSEAELRQARKDLARIERQISKVDAQKGKVQQQMNDAGGKADADFEHIAGLNARLQELQTEIEDLEMQWMDAAEVLGE